MNIADIIKGLDSLEESDVLLRASYEGYVFYELLGPDRGKWRLMLDPSYPVKYLSITTSIDAARKLFFLAFPGWLYRVMECSVSDDAWVTPDFNHPVHGHDLQKRFPDAMKDPVEWFGTDVDLRPPGRPATAFCISMLIAKQKIAEIESVTATAS